MSNCLAVSIIIFVRMCACECFTICPGISDPFYIVGYYIRLVTTSWTHSIWFASYFLISQFKLYISWFYHDTPAGTLYY